jgi:hypothetical protein
MCRAAGSGTMLAVARAERPPPNDTTTESIMIAHTPLQTRQRPHGPHALATGRARRHARIVVLATPAPGPRDAARRSAGTIRDRDRDDLEMATWEDAEWR